MDIALKNTLHCTAKMARKPRQTLKKFPRKAKNVTENYEKSQKLKICFVIYDHVLASSVTLPVELLRAAENLHQASGAASEIASRLEVVVASPDGKPRKTHGGLELAADMALPDIDAADAIFLPALWRNPFPVIRKNEIVLGWLKEMFSRETTRIAGVGTGCFFMAEAQLLDRRVATTHWYFFDLFEQKFPLVKLDRHHFITQSDRLYCAGSMNALGDLTTHLINDFYGSAVSSAVERHFFHDIRQSYSNSARVENTFHSHPDELVVDAQLLIAQNIAEAPDFSEIAERVGLSRRQLDRRFKEATGLSPHAYLQQQRITAARDLLKNTNLSVAEIMANSGYQDSGHFSRLFSQHYGMSPRQYRATVRAKLFASPAVNGANSV